MRFNLYVPDELGQRIKSLDLPIAAICQPALRAAVERRELGGPDALTLEERVARLEAFFPPPHPARKAEPDR